MELADYLRVLRRRWLLILVIMLVCGGAAAGASFAQTPRYTTSTRLLVSGGQGDNAIDEIARRQLANQRAVAYAQLVDTGPADAAATEAANAAGASPDTTAVADGNSPFIIVTVAANSAAAAQAVANAYVTVLPDVIRRLEQTPSSTPPEITALESAPRPDTPTSPVHQRDILVGIVLGIVLGVAGALIREALDARIRDSMEIEKATGAMLLGSVPKENAADVLVSATRPRSGRAEAYRHIRTNLEFTGPGGMPRSIVVTSPAPSEGKSSLCANLAIVTSRSGRNVMLVDADLRKPAVAKYFGLEAGAGLTDVLTGQVSWQEATVQLPGERIHVLPSGAIPKFPSELVGSARMAQLIQELEAVYDLVIIDTPPVLPVSDALIMGVNAGGVVLVARMKETRRAAIKRAVEAVTKVDANLLGVVANAAVRGEEKAYGEGYGYAYGYISKDAANSAADAGDGAAPPSMEPALRRGRHSDPSAEVPAPASAPAAPEPSRYPAPAPNGSQLVPPAPPYPAQPNGAQPVPPAPPYPAQPNGARPPQPAQPAQPQNGYAPSGSRPPQPAQPQNGYAPRNGTRGTPPAQPYPAQPDATQPRGLQLNAIQPDATRPAPQLRHWPTQQAGPVSPVEPMTVDDILRRPPAS